MKRAPESGSHVPDPPGSTVGRFRKWALGASLAAVTAVVIQALTGAFTSVGSALWDLVTGQEPVEVTVLSDLSFLQNQSFSRTCAFGCWSDDHPSKVPTSSMASSVARYLPDGSKWLWTNPPRTLSTRLTTAVGTPGSPGRISPRVRRSIGTP